MKGHRPKPAGYLTRDPKLPPDILRPLGLLATSGLDAGSVYLAVERIRAPGWGNPAGDAIRVGWTQRRAKSGGVFLFEALGRAMYGGDFDVGRAGAGWLNIVVRPQDSLIGTTIEVRGELDASMDQALRTSLAGFDLTVLRTWDPTIP